MADQTFAVTVVASSGGNRYRFDGGSLDAETLELTEGKTYSIYAGRFQQLRPPASI